MGAAKSHAKKRRVAKKASPSRSTSREQPRATKAPAKSSHVRDSPFAAVARIVRRIPHGRVATYGQIAAMIGGRLSPVGVGWALRAAPDGSIPWHRVINAQGRVSTDGDHPGLQRAMLEAEGIVFDVDGRIDLAVFGW